MQNKFTYEYAIIRLVPKVEREEFFNVGVLLFSKQKNYIGIKYAIDPEKLKVFSSEIDIDTFTGYLDAWKLISKGDPSGGEIAKLDLANRFRWLAASRSTMIQSSKTHSGLCLNPEEELEDIFNKYVL